MVILFRASNASGAMKESYSALGLLYKRCCLPGGWARYITQSLKPPPAISNYARPAYCSRRRRGKCRPTARLE